MSELSFLGARIGQYRIAREIGRGGMGLVYEAIHDEIGQRAAVKVLAPRCTHDPQYVRRFLNEARTISRVHHPGLVQIYDFGQTSSGTPYILMELLEGETLRDRQERRAGEEGLLPAAEVRRVVRQIAAALAAIHEEGIVHRDLKPDNVMLVSDEEAPGGERVKLLDFGIARFIGSQDATLTAPGAVLGTSAYMSPEQCAADEEIGAAADVYALGVMLHELLAGAPPFEGLKSLEIMHKHLCVEPPPPPATAPEDLTRLVAQMLAKEPSRRPSMRDVAGALSEGREGPGKPPARGSQELTAPKDPRGLPTRSLAPGAATTPWLPATRPAPRRPVRWPWLEAARRGAGAVARGAGRRPARWLATIAVAAAIVVGVLVSRPSRSPAPVRPSAELPGMVWLSGGTFRMGRSEQEVKAECERLGEDCHQALLMREQPARPVTLSPFYIDQREATNAEIAVWLNIMKPSIETRIDDEIRLPRWVALGGVRLIDLYPPYAGIVRDPDGSFRARPGDEHKPATQLTWDGASQYCKSRAKRLPTDAEWELAARGRTDRRFPWGDQVPGCGEVAWGREADMPCHLPLPWSAGLGPVEVGTTSLDRTPEGIQDLGGNVMEWVQDQYVKPYLPPCGTCVDPVVEQPVPLHEDYRVLRGGNWGMEWHMSRTTMRARWKRTEVMMGSGGVRCASR